MKNLLSASFLIIGLILATGTTTIAAPAPSVKGTLHTSKVSFGPPCPRPEPGNPGVPF